MTSIEAVKKYLGKTFVGFTIPGQCVALFNQVNLDVLGVRYPIQGASTAKDILTTTNTQPDLVQQIKNNPNDPNLLPSIGDWVIWNKNWGNGAGHISCVESVSVTAFTGVEQNYLPNKVTRQTHDWTNVIGWVHYINQGDEMLTRQDITDEYQVNRGSDPSEAEIAAHQNGGTWRSMSLGFRGENNATRSNVQKALSDLQTALQNEKNKPPKEVVKEIGKIVTKIEYIDRPVDEKLVVTNWLKKLWDKLFK